MIWTAYDWLNKFYNFYMAAVVGIVSRRGLSIEVYRRNQPNKSIASDVQPATFTLTIVYV